MKTIKIKSFVASTAIAAVLYLALVLSDYYLGLFVESDLIGYLMLFLTEFLSQLIPMLGLTLLFLTRVTGRGAQFSLCLLWASARFFNLLPTYYLLYMSIYAHSADALLLAALHAILETLVYGVGLFLLQWIAEPIARRKSGVADLTSLDTRLLVYGGAIALLLAVSRIVEIVEFMTRHFDTFTLGEVLSIVASLLMIPVAWMAAHKICRACAVERGGDATSADRS